MDNEEKLSFAIAEITKVITELEHYYKSHRDSDSVLVDIDKNRLKSATTLIREVRESL